MRSPFTTSPDNMARITSGATSSVTVAIFPQTGQYFSWSGLSCSQVLRETIFHTFPGNKRQPRMAVALNDSVEDVCVFSLFFAILLPLSSGSTVEG